MVNWEASHQASKTDGNKLLLFLLPSVKAAASPAAQAPRSHMPAACPGSHATRHPRGSSEAGAAPGDQVPWARRPAGRLPAPLPARAPPRSSPARTRRQRRRAAAGFPAAERKPESRVPASAWCAGGGAGARRGLPLLMAWPPPPPGQARLGGAAAAAPRCPAGRGARRRRPAGLLGAPACRKPIERPGARARARAGARARAQAGGAAAAGAKRRRRAVGAGMATAPPACASAGAGGGVRSESERGRRRLTQPLASARGRDRPPRSLTPHHTCIATRAHTDMHTLT